MSRQSLSLRTRDSRSSNRQGSGQPTNQSFKSTIRFGLRNRTRKQPFRGLRPHSRFKTMTEQLAHDPERDSQILEVTNSLCQQLGITNYHPTFVSWQVYAYENRRNPSKRKEFPPDDCLLEQYCVTLPGSMKGKLHPDEWKPIIASALIFSKKMRRRTFYGFLLPAILFVALAVLVALEFPGLFPQPFSSTDRSGNSYTVPIGSIFGNICALVLAGPGTVITGTMIARKTRLRAEENAADLVGTQNFLSSLRKIAGMTNPQQLKRGGGIARPFPLLPSLDARISRLEENQT